MGPLNKERIVMLAALAIAIYGLATAFSGEGVSGAVPEVPPPGGKVPVPPMNIVKLDLLDQPFTLLWGGSNPAQMRNPWIPPKRTTRPTQVDFRMPEPQLRRMARIVPAPPFAPRQSHRPVIRQTEPPASLDQTQPGEETEDNEE